MKQENKKFISEEHLRALKYFSEKREGLLVGCGKEIERYRAVSGLSGMNFFYDAVLNSRRELRGKNSRPVVGYYCNTIPEEIIIACGAVPMRLCSADSHCAEAGEEAVSGEICPMIKSACGDFYHRFKDTIDLLTLPATCDGKVKLAEVLSPVAKDIYFIDMPRHTDYTKNTGIWTDAYFKFYEYLKKRYGARPDRKQLVDACRKTNERTKIFRKIYEYRAKNPAAMNSFDYFIMAHSSFFVAPEEWCRRAGVVREELGGRERLMPDGAKKILLAGSPVLFPNFKILEILEEAGCYVAAEVMCSAYGHLFNPVEIDEETDSGIIRALTLKYIAPSICPCFLGVDKLINAILDAVKEYRLDGVVYYNIRLCNVFEIQTTILRNILKEKGVSLLVLKTDFSKEDTGQLKTRIEAFKEILG